MVGQFLEEISDGIRESTGVCLRDCRDYRR